MNKKQNDEIIFSNILVTGDDDFLVLAIDRLLCGFNMLTCLAIKSGKHNLIYTLNEVLLLGIAMLMVILAHFKPIT